MHEALSGAPRVPAAMMVGSWLSVSETFLLDQVRHAERFALRVIAQARGRTRPAHDDVRTMTPPERLAYFHFGLAPRLAGWLRGRRLVHAHFGVNGALVLPLARRLGLPLAVTWHGHDVGGLLPRNRSTLRYRRLHAHAPALFEYAGLHLCSSEELATLLVGFGAPEARVRVHRLGIDLGFFEPPTGARAEAPTALFVGRLVEKKGVDDALRAFARARERLPEARFRIVGDGALGPRLRALASELGVADAVVFLGALPAGAVRAEMGRAHVLLSPSFTTSSGDRESGVLVLKEASASGMPVIGTRHGGIPEIVVDDETGFLVEERDVDALAERLLRVLSDETLRARLGAAGRAFMEREYDTRAQNRRLEAALATLL